MELASFWGQKSEGKVWAIFFQGLGKAPGRLLAGFWVLPAIFGTHSAHRWVILPTAFVSAWHLRNVSTGFLFTSPSYNDSITLDLGPIQILIILIWFHLQVIFTDYLCPWIFWDTIQPKEMILDHSAINQIGTCAYLMC